MKGTLAEPVAIGNNNQRNVELTNHQLDPLAVFGIIGSVAVQLAVRGFCKVGQVIENAGVIQW